MSTLAQSHTLVKTKPVVAHGGIVFALAPRIKRFFQEAFDPQKSFPVPWQWLEVELLDRDQWEESLYRLRPEVLVTGWGTPALPERYALTDDLPLRYVCHLAGGVKPLVPRRLIERGVLVSNWGNAISYTIAEHAILLVLSLLRNQPAWSDFIDRWHDHRHTFPCEALHTRSLRGKRVGLHGFGLIAREIVQMLRPFRVELSAYSSGVSKSLFHEHDVRQARDLEDLFANNDVIIECEAVNSHTRGVVTERVLRLLPKQAIFVNVGRAAVVDDVALERLVLEGRLFAGLDVHREEPVPWHAPLLTTDRALLSPHVAGPTEDAMRVLCDFAIANLLRFSRSQPIEGMVSLDVYDRTT